MIFNYFTFFPESSCCLLALYIFPLCDTVCQWLTTGRWFSLDTPLRFEELFNKKLSPLLFFFIFLCFLNLIMLFLFWDFNNFFLSRSRMRISFRFRYWTMVCLFCVSILFLKGYMHWDLKEIFWKFFTHIIYIIKITKFFIPIYIS